MFIKMKIGVIAGNFDVIHPGYIYMFNECVLSCDELVVLLHDDPSIERPEKLKPILSVEERMLILKSLKHVDRVFTYNTESELYKLLTEIKPDVRFLGDDYINKPFTGDDLDIRIYYLDRSHGWSTTKYKKMIAETLKIG
jgi:glycerol-3-phosphate cytidylyltransferase